MVVRYWQNTSSCTNALASNNHSTIVQWRVLEKDVLNESLVNACIDKVARVYDVVKSQATLYYDERSHFASRHVHTCHNNRHDSLLVYSRLRLVAHEEETHNGLEPLMRAQRI